MVPIADASSVNYTVSAFALLPYVFSNRTVSTTLNAGQALFYKDANGGYPSGGGYIITIPANTSPGYLIVAGIYPATASISQSNSWQSTNGYIQRPGYYSLTSNISTTPSASDSPFDGIVYIPAHNTTLYLVVGDYYLDTSANVIGNGAVRISSAYIGWFADNSSPDYTSILQSINSSLQLIYQAILTNGQTETAINDKLADMANTLLSILSALQSNSGNVSGIVSALDTVNDKLQSTLDQLTSSDDDNELTQQILDKMDELMEEIDELNLTINDKANRPPPEDIVPSMPPQLLEPTDPSAIEGRNFITDLLSSQFFLTFLLMVFTLAFIRYVLFGKSK